MARWIIVCFAIFLVLSASELVTAQDANDESPFIYYYANSENAIVIERADGTDSRVFAPGLLSSSGQLSYAAWSPSGTWFSWTESFGSGGYFERRPHAMAVNSGQTVTSLAVWQDAVIDWWTPYDLLVVNGRVGDYWTTDGHVRGEISMRAAIIDPETDSILQSVDYSVDVDVYEFALYRVSFHSDTAVIRYQDRVALMQRESDTWESVYLLFDRSGRIVERRYPGDFHFDLSPNHTVLHFDNERMMIRHIDLVSNLVLSTVSIDLAPSHDAPMWNNDGSAAVIISDEAYWLWDSNQGVLIEVPNVEVSVRNQDQRRQWWSPSGNHLALLDDQNRLIVLDRHTQVPIVVSDRVFLWMWIDSGHLAMSISDNPRMIGIYAVEAETLMTHSVDDEIVEPFISPDLHYIAWITDHPRVMNRQTNAIVELPVHIDWTSQMGHGGEINWHPSSRWLIIGQRNRFDNPATPLLSTANADGSLHRDIAVCYSSYCVDWLPPQIDLSAFLGR